MPTKFTFKSFVILIDSLQNLYSTFLNPVTYLKQSLPKIYKLLSYAEICYSTKVSQPTYNLHCFFVILKTCC